MQNFCERNSLNFKDEFKFFETSWSPCGLCWHAINGSNGARKVKMLRCTYGFYSILSFTDVCSISESDFNLGRLDRNTNENTDDIPTNQNTDTNDNIPTTDQTVMVWKRTRKSFSVRIEGFSLTHPRWSQNRYHLANNIIASAVHLLHLIYLSTIMYATV